MYTHNGWHWSDLQYPEHTCGNITVGMLAQVWGNYSQNRASKPCKLTLLPATVHGPGVTWNVTLHTYILAVLCTHMQTCTACICRYDQLAEYVLGPKKGRAVLLPFQMAACVGTACTYAVVGGDNMAAFAAGVTPGYTQVMGKWTYYILFGVVELLLSMVSSRSVCSLQPPCKGFHMIRRSCMAKLPRLGRSLGLLLSRPVVPVFPSHTLGVAAAGCSHCSISRVPAGQLHARLVEPSH